MRRHTSHALGAAAFATAAVFALVSCASSSSGARDATTLPAASVSTSTGSNSNAATTTGAPDVAAPSTAVAGDTSSTAPTVTAQGVVSDADVAKQLQEVMNLASELAAAVQAGDQKTVNARADSMVKAWTPIDATVKANEPQLYAGIADALTAVQQAGKDKDVQTVNKQRENLITLGNEYLRKHPGP